MVRLGFFYIFLFCFADRTLFLIVLFYGLYSFPFTHIVCSFSFDCVYVHVIIQSAAQAADIMVL